jgi:methylglutaconyl-CoA hydratase
MSDDPVLWNLDARGVATVTLNRPQVNNAYNGAMIQGLYTAMDALGSEAGLRVVVLKGNGKHFQAGADLTWINAARVGTPEDNLVVSRATATAVDRLNRLPVPVVALVQGGCFGGGTGIISACDIVIAADNALFSITEVRWGLHASIIFPQLNDAIGVRQVRRYALTGERFGAEEARRIGLVHEVVPLAGLGARGDKIISTLLENAPGALARTKQHILEHAWGGFDAATLDALIQSHSDQRQTAEAAEGLASFAGKRSARWAPE